jgi:hypothetical protein
VGPHDLALRRAIYESFAATGEPPVLDGLESLAEQHVVVLDDGGRILMAHPFAGHTNGARVRAQGRTWWGNCAWDGLGIVAALDLQDATITAQGITLPADDAVFHVEVPARHWWDDIGFT